MIRHAISSLLTLMLAVTSLGVLAAECGGIHTVKEDETIIDIAEQYYGDGKKWSAIYYTNQQELDHDPTNIEQGIDLKVPCLTTSAETTKEPALRQEDADLKLLTGGDYSPFTDKDLPGSGLITELVNASFEVGPSPVPFSLTWVDDWSQHLFPLLDEKQYDVGFPWLQPDCGSNPDSDRCKKFHFSKPLFEMLVFLFVREDNPIEFETDADVKGVTLCRPQGYYTHDLDRQNRRWLSEGTITLQQPATLADCFNDLAAGRVDAVAVNEFTGRAKLTELGLQDQIVALERPLSIEGLHVLISKTHPRGTTFLYRFNAGLEKLKQSDRYNRIVERHLSAYWERIAVAEDEQDQLPGAKDKDVRLLTASDYEPFTDKKLMRGGLVTDIVNQAADKAPSIDDHGFAWINDWAAHLDPLLSEHTYDMGFPWLRPDCEGNPDAFRCKEFLFSEPMFEMLVVLFMEHSRTFEFTQDSDIEGRNLCRPEGYYTHDLEKNGRNWLSEEKITLTQPRTVDDCFELLLDGSVDAVVLNEFTGQSALARLDIEDQITAPKHTPLSIEGLHVLVHKSHPEAVALISSINDGLAGIKEDGTYKKTVDAHLEAFWERVEEQRSAGAEPSTSDDSADSGNKDQVVLLTAGDYEPFTDPDLRDGGMISSLVQSAIRQTGQVGDFGIEWVPDWSRHLDPLLSEHTHDLGFPWLQPDCEGNPDSFRCAEFIFSKPMFEMLVVLYMDSSRTFNFTSDSDIEGRTLCRPRGYYTHDLEKNGRRWLTDDLIELEQPESVDDCFKMLTDGTVDAVALNEFSGRSAMARLGIEDQVEVLEENPLSIEGLHVLVHKSHPEADNLIKVVNEGLVAIRENGRYQEIVDAHLDEFWQQF